MNIITAFKAQVKKYKEEEQQRAERQLANARTKAAREKERAKIEREKLETKREISQARIALLKSEAARRRAAQEVKDLGDGFFGSTRKALAPKKVTVHRKSVTRKRAKSKRN